MFLQTLQSRAPPLLAPAVQGAGAAMAEFLPGICCQRVLCWVGYLHERDPVVEVAQALARAGNGRCELVLGLDAPRRLDQVPAGPLTPELIGQAERRLGQLYGSASRTMVLPGHPVREVRRYARNQRADLIVMGLQALQVEQSCGERLADEAPCPIMILLRPRPEHDQPTTRPPSREPSFSPSSPTGQPSAGQTPSRSTRAAKEPR